MGKQRPAAAPTSQGTLQAARQPQKPGEGPTADSPSCPEGTNPADLGLLASRTERESISAV